MRKCNNANGTAPRWEKHESVSISGSSVAITDKSGNTTAHEIPNKGQRFKVARKAAGWPKMELVQVQLRD